ncbi:SpoIIE family protein phosphatase [Mycobacterium sp.]|uniref:SpoIIE family protein phosphatase n=1 Tax=Mycobacterium sp. TaxID=1785 RepID=UPI002D5747BD|nr:SpoIIE family protein phosphatase [Mycobacterium sp.]HZA08941.1 SpoIIE family protein phosphatase [Mycobacterium sp.]
MTAFDDFHVEYAAALRDYLDAPGEAALAIAHELGRRALREQISMLDIVENHFRLTEELAKNTAPDTAAALQFLLQTLAALDVVTRGFLDGTRRYQQQRARADDLASRDEFHTALVNSLQEGFFVADHDGAVVEINDAFAEITGYGPEDLPYRWHHPWAVDNEAATERLSRLVSEGHLEAQAPIRHRDGHIVWVAMSVNAVTAGGAQRDAYVGTIRDITAARAAAQRESAVMRLATAVGVAKGVGEVLSITLDESRTAIDVQRVVAVVWPQGDGGEPTIEVAGSPSASTWRDLDPWLRREFEAARHRLPLTVEPVDMVGDPGKSCGMMAVLSGTGDVGLWLEHRMPRRVSTEDRLLVNAVVGHLSLAMQHVRQFETARETSLTLQRAMLPPAACPPGFTVRYEPAVPPLEIGGDWYDVLPVGDNRICVIVGDCVGRGLSAAAVMGQLRSSARALLLTGAEPAVALDQLDSTAALIPDALCTTVFLAIIDTETRVVQYSSAGHPPAVLATPQWGTKLLDAARSVPLAVHRDHPRPQASHVLPFGSTLMLFTDGLVERRDSSIDEGIARAAEILLGTSGLPLDAVADVVVSELAPEGGYDDDVAIVVCRPQHAALRIEHDATPDRLIDVRHRLAAWLREAAVSDPVTADIVLAVNEACTNSVEHAYRRREPGKIRVEAENRGTEIRIRVVDSGFWKAPAADPGTRGRGLPLIKALSDQGVLDGTPEGTTIDMRFRLPAKGSASVDR